MVCYGCHAIVWIYYVGKDNIIFLINLHLVFINFEMLTILGILLVIIRSYK